MFNVNIEETTLSEKADTVILYSSVMLFSTCVYAMGHLTYIMTII